MTKASPFGHSDQIIPTRKKTGAFLSGQWVEAGTRVRATEFEGEKQYLAVVMESDSRDDKRFVDVAFLNDAPQGYKVGPTHTLPSNQVTLP